MQLQVQVLSGVPFMRANPMRTLIGSQAANFWYPNISLPVGTDYDVLLSHSEAEEFCQRDLPFDSASWNAGGGIEVHNLDFLNNDKISAYNTECQVKIRGTRFSVCSPRGLAAIMRSHLWRPRHKFAKNITRYQHLDRSFCESDWAFIREREQLTKRVFPEYLPPKDVSNEQFFRDNVTKHFPHDDIHPFVAYREHPVYLSLKKDFSKAAIDEELWESSPKVTKHMAVLEECYVIALERYIIPALLEGRRYPYRLAFLNALEKACTTLSGGSFREHAIDNYALLANICDVRKMENFTKSEYYATRTS